jgi:hypothetical protein
MGIAVGIVLTVVLIALVVMSRRNKASTDRRPPSRSRPDLAKTGSQYHAVSIHFTGSVCEAAKAMEGKRFLASAAPRIPLPECDVPACKCHFSHHQDRRRGQERRGGIPDDLLGTTGGYSGKERRFHERRSDDEPDDFFS